MKELLEKLNACDEAKVWAANKTWSEIFETCHRGDWLLWLFKKVNPDDLQLLTLAKGHCVATVLHFMKDERSKKAVQVSIDFGNGNATKEELDAAAADAADAAADADVAAYAAYAAAYAAAAAYAYAYAAAAAAAAAAADVAAYAAYAAAAYAAAADAAAADAYAAYAAYAAKIENQKLTAAIVRKYIPINLWNITKDIEL